MKLLIDSQTSKIVPLEYGTEWVIFSYTLPLGMWLLIHAGVLQSPYKGKASDGNVINAVFPDLRFPL